MGSNLDQLLKALNKGQHKATVSSGHCVVCALPGSGKTRVLQTRAVYLLDQDPNNIVCAVTFTKDAADELKSRIAAEIGESALDRVITGTFHALAKRQLREASTGMHLISGGEQYALVERARDLAYPDIRMEDALKIIESLKGSLHPKSDDKDAMRLLDEYTKMLKKHRAMDFADLLIESTLGMQRGNVDPLPCSHLLVDEVQDADKVQYAWIESHLENGAKVTLVGDDDQSIYSFRKATGYAGMTGFASRHGAEIVTMDTNYRCKSEILAHAEKLILHNKERISKTLIAASGPGAIIETHRLADRPDECQAIAYAVRDTPEEWGVIARTNAILDDMQAKLTEMKIPHTRLGGGDLWSWRALQAFLGLLKSIHTGKGLGAEHALQFAGTGSNVIDHLHKKGWLEGGAVVPEGTKFRGEKVSSLIDQLPKWREQARAGRPAVAIAGAGAWFRKNFTKPGHLKRFNVGYKAILDMKGSIGARLNYISQRKKDDEKEGVILMTMHASKGLEFEKVWIMASEEKTIPSPEAELISEERRLFYVAMTRAKDMLMISSAQPEQFTRFVFESEVLRGDAKSAA